MSFMGYYDSIRDISDQIINQAGISEKQSKWYTEQEIQRIEIKIDNMYKFRVRVMKLINATFQNISNNLSPTVRKHEISSTYQPTFECDSFWSDWEESCEDYYTDAIRYREIVKAKIHNMKNQTKRILYIEELIDRETRLLQLLYKKFRSHKDPLLYEKKDMIRNLISYSILDTNGTISEKYIKQLEEIEKLL